MTYLIRNTGNVRLSADQLATVTGLIGGSRQADKLARVPEVLPGSSVQVTAEVRGVLPAVRITATATITPRSENNASDPSLSRVARSASLWVLPSLAIGLFVLVVLIGLLLWLRHRSSTAPSHRQAPSSATLVGVRRSSFMSAYRDVSAATGGFR